MKQKLKRNLFIIYCSVLILMMFLGFYIADRNIRKTSFGDTTSFIEINEGMPYIYELCINGSKNHYMIDLSFLSIIDKIRYGL